MKQFILDKHDEVPKEVFVTLMKSLDVETFCDVVYALKTKAQKQRTETIYTTYSFRFWWGNDKRRQQGIIQDETRFGVPSSNHEDRWVSFEIKGEVRPKGTVVWLAVDLKDEPDLHYESRAWRTAAEAFDSLNDGYMFDFYRVREDRGDAEAKVRSKILSGQFYAERFAVLEVELP